MICRARVVWATSSTEAEGKGDLLRATRPRRIGITPAAPVPVSRSHARRSEMSQRVDAGRQKRRKKEVMAAAWGDRVHTYDRGKEGGVVIGE